MCWRSMASYGVTTSGGKAAPYDAQARLPRHSLTEPRDHLPVAASTSFTLSQKSLNGERRFASTSSVLFILEKPAKPAARAIARRSVDGVRLGSLCRFG